MTDAMRTGVPGIYSTAFLAPPWHGFAGFLRRGERPSGLGAWSCEAVDTKLAPSPRGRRAATRRSGVDLIERSSPGLADCSGGSTVRSGENLIEAATRRALALDRSILFIQGLARPTPART